MTALLPAGDVAGRVIVLTGASSGIGASAARTLTTLGADVAVVGRNRERTEETAARLGARAFVADFGRLADVRELAYELLERYPRIDVLANNAGGIVPRRAYTTDRNERTFQESVLGGFLLTTLLLPRLRATATTAPEGTVRIIQTASAANRGGRIRLDDLDTLRGPWLGGWRAYNAAKLANILLTRELARRTATTGVSAYSFHPGLVRTEFGRQNFSVQLASILTGGHYGLSPEQGAEPLVRLAASPGIPAPSGTYFTRLEAHGPTANQADDADLGRRLWTAAEERISGFRDQAAPALPSRH